MFATSGFGEEGVERVVRHPGGVVRGHLAVGVDPMLQAVELPGSIAHLAAGLTDMDGYNFSLQRNVPLLVRLWNFNNIDFSIRQNKIFREK